MSISSATAVSPRMSDLAAANRSTGATAMRWSMYGTLSSQQLATLRAAVGYDFHWPPTTDSGPFPLAAAVLAQQQNLSGDIASQKQLTASGLQALAAAGLLDAAAVARGTAYLRGEHSATAGHTAAPPAPASGTVAADGSRYL